MLRGIVETRYKHPSRHRVKTEALVLVTEERNIFQYFLFVNGNCLIRTRAVPSSWPLQATTHSHRKPGAPSFFFSAVPQQVNAPTRHHACASSNSLELYTDRVAILKKKLRTTRLSCVHDTRTARHLVTNDGVASSRAALCTVRDHARLFDAECLLA